MRNDQNPPGPRSQPPRSMTAKGSSPPEGTTTSKTNKGQDQGAPSGGRLNPSGWNASQRQADDRSKSPKLVNGQ